MPTETVTTWLFVAHTTLHLDGLKAGEESWWCVDRGSKPGDRAFIYRPLKGIALHVEILEHLKTPEMFCNSYQMGTARIKVLNVFAPPISSKALKASKVVGAEGFVRRNFQGKSFVLHSEKAPAAILSIAKETSRASAMADNTKAPPAKSKTPAPKPKKKT